MLRLEFGSGRKNVKHRLAIGLAGLWICLTGSAGIAQTPIAAEETLPAARVPSAIEAVSPDGQFAVSETYGPGSSQNNILLFDLTGKRPLRQWSYARQPNFIAGGKALLYWSYDLGGRNGLYLLPLPQGVARRIYPKTEQAETSGSANGTYETDWNPQTGEVVMVRSGDAGKSASVALRLRDGRMRLLGVGPGVPHFSPDSAAAIWTGVGLYQGGGREENLWLSGRDGKRRALLSGRFLGWLPNSRDLLLVRAGSLRQISPGSFAHDQALHRLDTRTGRLTLLAEASPQATLFQSRSGNWIGVLDQHRLHLLRAADGASLALPREGIEAFAWGRADTELYLRQAGVWHRLTLRLEAPLAALPPAAPFFPPDPITLTPPEAKPFQWQPVPEADAPWRIYANTGELRALTALDGKLMLGTTGGLRILKADGRESRTADWTRALRGSDITAFAVQPDSLYLGLQRGMANGSEEDVLARLDRKSSRLVQTSLGYGRQEGRLNALFRVGSQTIGLTSGGGGLTVWDEAAQEVSRWSGPLQALFRGANTAIPSRDGGVWIGLREGLVQWKPGTVTAEVWTEKHGLAANATSALAETGDRLWIGTIAGLSLLEEKTGRIARTVGPEALHRATITQILSTRQTLYVASAEGLFARASATGVWKRLPLPSRAKSRFYTVGERLFRSGDVSEPLQKLDSAGRWQTVASASVGQLPDNQVRVVHVVNDVLWCGTTRHVARLNAATGTFRSYPLPEGSGGVVSLASEGSAVWAVLWKGGALQLDPQTDRIRRWLAQFLVVGWTAAEAPDLVAVVPHSDYLYAVAYQGFLWVNRATGQTERLSLRDLGPAGGFGAASLLRADPDRLWVVAEADRNSRLLEIRLRDRKVTELPLPPALLHAGAPEPGKGFWVRQDKEIALLTLKGEVLAHYPLPSETSYYGLDALTRTGEGSLWFAAGSTIFRLNTGTGLWQQYACPLANIRSIALLDHTLWVATEHGLASLRLAADAQVGRGRRAGRAF
jgi:streptogramin lyase